MRPKKVAPATWSPRRPPRGLLQRAKQTPDRWCPKLKRCCCYCRHWRFRRWCRSPCWRLKGMPCPWRARCGDVYGGLISLSPSSPAPGANLGRGRRRLERPWNQRPQRRQPTGDWPRSEKVPREDIRRDRPMSPPRGNVRTTAPRLPQCPPTKCVSGVRLRRRRLCIQGLARPVALALAESRALRTTTESPPCRGPPRKCRRQRPRRKPDALRSPRLN
mmetsp:Transcript_88260/g.248490  ORF Transcript_88260/g.248490 Transcript_88260/m.248490 type:complete len:218 (-) Transcript_88260:2371-3024(-)